MSDRILGNDGIWKFNFYDKFFNPDDTLTIEYKDPAESESVGVLYGHKQLLRFHSPLFQNQEAIFISRAMEKWRIEKCFQMAHGVRIRLYNNYWLSLWTAHYNKLRNVIQYADQQLVEKYWSPKDELHYISVYENCIELGMRHLLAHLVNQFTGLKGLKTIIRELDIQKMSGEVMKTFMAKIFKLTT